MGSRPDMIKEGRLWQTKLPGEALISAQEAPRPKNNPDKLIFPLKFWEFHEYLFPGAPLPPPPSKDWWEEAESSPRQCQDFKASCKESFLEAAHQRVALEPAQVRGGKRAGNSLRL